MYIKKTYPARELVHIVLVDKDILGWLVGTDPCIILIIDNN